MNNKIKRISLSEQVLDSIIHYIQENNLHVGDKLPTEGEFSKLFQVSRTSVREAIKALSINGAVESIPGKGTYICVPIMDTMLNKNTSPDAILKAKASISEIMEVRTTLEIMAADLAIERGTPEDMELLASAMNELDNAISHKKPWALAGSKFHTQIAEMSGNTLLLTMIKSLSATVERYKSSLMEADTQMNNHLEEHKNIFIALYNKDKKALHKAIRTHMKTTENDLKRLVNKTSASTFITHTEEDEEKNPAKKTL